MVDAKREIAELEELRALTGDGLEAQRLAWSPMWLRARAWFEEKLAELPVEHHYDAAGNHWVTLAGGSSGIVVALACAYVGLRPTLVQDGPPALSTADILQEDVRQPYAGREF